MAHKSQPYFEAWAYPLYAQMRYAGRHLSISDNIANLDRGAGADMGFSGPMPETSLSQPVMGPGQGGHVVEVDGLVWRDLTDQDDKTSIAGYTIAPRIIAMSSMLKEEKKVNPPGGTTALVWQPSPGQEDYWRTCIPDREPLSTALRYSNIDMVTGCGAAQTTKPIPANQPFRLELQCLAANKGAGTLQPWMLVSWGTFGLYFVAGQTPMLVQRLPQGSGASGSPCVKPLRHLPALAGFWGREMLSVDVEYHGGRMAIVHQSGSVIYTDRARNSDPTALQEGKVKPVIAAAAPMSVQSQGVSFTMRPHEIAYGDSVVENPDGGMSASDLQVSTTNVKGYFKRRFYSGSPVQDTNTMGEVFGHDPVLANGKGSGIKATQLGSVSVEKTGPLEYNYRCEIDARNTIPVPLEEAWEDGPFQYGGEHCMRGQKTPLIDRVTLRQTPTWRPVVTTDPVDVRPALMSASENMADPALQAGTTWSFHADRSILADLGHPSGVGTLGPEGFDGNNAPTGWNAFVNKYHAIAVNVGWIYDDGSIRAYSTDGTNKGKICRLYGYQTGNAPKAQHVNDRALDFGAKDPIMRLQAPAATIDERYAALDFLYVDKQRRTPANRKAALFGADCVKYILSVGLGQEYANALQVAYPGHPLALWSEDARPNFYSIYDYRMFCDPPSGGGFLWPPPFGKCGLDWITQLCDVDFAMFFFAPSVAAANNLAPTYANYFEYVQGTPTTDIPDATYQPSDVDKLMASLEWQQLLQNDFNRVAVWGAAPGQPPLGGIVPALPQFSSNAVVPSTVPEQQASLTWERTKVHSGQQFYLPGVAYRVALAMAMLLSNVEVRRLSATCRGIEWLWWGQKAQFTATGPESDPALTFPAPVGDGKQTFRIMRIRNQYQFDRGANWTCNLSVADQPANYNMAGR